MPSRQTPPDDHFEIEEINLGPGVDKKVQEQAIAHEGRYATLGLIVGSVCLIAGIALIVLGFTGSVEIAFQGAKTQGHLATGSLGIVVVLVGGLIIWFTRFRVRIAGKG